MSEDRVNIRAKVSVLKETTEEQEIEIPRYTCDHCGKVRALDRTEAEFAVNSGGGGISWRPPGWMQIDYGSRRAHLCSDCQEAVLVEIRARR